MQRKDFLKMTALAAAGLAMSRSLASAFSPFPSANLNRPVIIIGTGYGASVIALRLAEKGIKVLMLEMGMEWPTNEKHETFCKMLKADRRSAWLRTHSIAPFANVFTFPKFTGVLDRLEFDNMKIYVGRGVGGGSLVNGGMAVTPRRSYFESILPEVDASEMYDSFFPEANKMLKVNHIDPAFYERTPYYRFARVAAEQAHKAGYKTSFVPNVYDFKYMEQEDAGTVYRSAFGGEVIYGNNAGKNSLDKTYLAKARATGLVDILTLQDVQDVIARDDGYQLKVNEINTKGEVIQRKTFSCKYLFVCAGSVGTSAILLKAKATHTLPGLNEHIGMHWGNNGNVMTGRNFVKQGTGAQQSCIPVMAIDDWENKQHPVFAEISPIPMSMEVWTTLYLAITKNPNRGSFRYDTASGKLSLALPQQFTEESVAATKALIRKLNKANGGTIAHLLFHNGIGDDICYHPLGGCVLGKASDLYGRVEGYKNLYAIDGSMIPGSTGVNPFVTITALAERNIDRIIKEDFA
jgi:cholesterol oxidase